MANGHAFGGSNCCFSVSICAAQSQTLKGELRYIYEGLIYRKASTKTFDCLFSTVLTRLEPSPVN